jgi:hypothetical protein
VNWGTHETQALRLSRLSDRAAKHLKQGQQASLESARGLGSQALAAGLQTLDLLKLHEQTLVTEVLPRCPTDNRAALIKQAGTFFTEAITSIEKIHRDKREAAVHLNQVVEMLSQRTVERAASNLELEKEIADALTHSSTDDLKIVELKRQKLHLREEIERLRHDLIL